MMSPKSLLALDMMNQKHGEEGQGKTYDRGCSEYSILSKSFNDPSAITFMRKQLSTMPITVDSQVMTDRDKIEMPIKREKIGNIINERQELKKLYLR